MLYIGLFERLTFHYLNVISIFVFVKNVTLFDTTVVTEFIPIIRF